MDSVSLAPDSASVDDALEDLPEFGADRRRRVKICLAILAVLSAGSMVGAASSLYLVEPYPLLLIALSPLSRHFMLVAPLIDPISLVVVGTARGLLFSTISFELGRTIGPRGLSWLERKYRGAGRILRWFERLFERAALVAVFVFPYGIMSAIAGISGMRWRVFVPIAVAGLVTRLLITLQFASWLREPILDLLDWIKAHRLSGTIALLSFIAIYQLWKARKRRGADVRERWRTLRPSPA